MGDILVSGWRDETPQIIGNQMGKNGQVTPKSKVPDFVY